MIIFHVDVNNAFLSWEALERKKEDPGCVDLRTIASVVGGSEKDRHGIVVAKSTPAKKYGIKTAETLADARKKCPQLTIVPPRHHVYQKYSQLLIRYLRRLSPAVEQFSIDEAFVDMTDSSLLKKYAPVDAANYIRSDIYARFGFTVNIGVSTTKILAKMASDFEKPNRVHSLFPEEIQEKMWGLPVKDLFFVGQASAKKLYNLGIRTIGELAQSDKEVLRTHMGKQGTLIHDYANGIDPSPVASRHSEAKGYGNSTTLSHDVTDRAEAMQTLRSLCESVATRLQNDDVMAQVVSVTIKDYTFHQSSHQCTFHTATSNTEELYRNVCELFDELWDGIPIRLLGVSTSKITRQKGHQLTIFNSAQYQKQGKFEQAVAEIRKKYGDDAVFRASSLEKRNL